MNQLPEWLSTIGYPAPGVGDLDDLNVTMSVGEYGKWVSLINPGWFYYNSKEQYHYILPGTQSISNVTSSGILSQSVSYRPSWGPVQIISDKTGYSYIQHSNSYYPGTTYSWTQISSSNYYYTNIPSGCMVTSARDLTNLTLGQVSTSGEVISDKFYAYNLGDQVVIIQPSDPTNINVFLDLVYYTPKLRFREAVIQNNGQLLPSYNPDYGLNNLICSKGYQSHTFSITITGAFTNPLSGIYDGDWVILEYWINNSFILSDDKTIQYYTYPGSTDSFTVYWESTIPDINKVTSLSINPTGIFNVNPLYPDSYRSGYLFHTNSSGSQSSYWTPSSLRMYCDKDKVIADCGEFLKVSLWLLGDNGLPIPNYPITISHSNNATSIVVHPSLTATDGRGEFHALFSVNPGIFTISCSAGLLTTFASSNCVTLKSQLNSEQLRKGFVNVVVSTDSTTSNSYTSYCSLTNLDGIPVNCNFQPDDSNHIQISSLLPSEFISNFGANNVQSSVGTINIIPQQSINNPLGIATFGYSPQPNDQLVANFDTAQSVILEIQ